MLGGILKGLFLGGIVGLVGVSVLSLLSPLPSNIESQTDSQVAQTEPAAPVAQQLDGTSEADAPVEANSTAQSPAPAAPVDDAPVAEVSSAPKPETAEVAGTPTVPNADRSGSVEVEQVEPVLPNPQAAPITTPADETELSISVEPAQPPSPTQVETQPFEAPNVAEAPTAPAETEAPQVSSDAPQANPQPGTDDAPSEFASPTAPQAPEVGDAEETVSLLKPATDIKDRFEQKTSTRLPSIQSGNAQPPVEDTAAAEPAPEAIVVEVSTAPLTDFGAEFANVENKPMMSIVLLDDVATELDVATLADFPLPLTIAVDASQADASNRMSTYRSMGLEVLAVVNLPTGSTATDVEVNLTAQLAEVSEAVAVLEGLDNGVQENREVSEQVIAYVLDSGHGLVMQPKGLNTAQKLAAREGVPSMSVFRDFDGAGQTEVVMRRFLDQAAFKARQTNGVIMMGRLQPETISALASWALQDRASTVAVAPVSAVLTAP